jgi:hypothetical protein
MSKIIKFGEDVEGYVIPVLNEREVRAAAGLFFLLMFISIMNAALLQQFLLLKYAIVIFLVDFAIRVFINPRIAPSLILGRFIVRNQTPEYVGAPQKKFAWVIGLVLAVIMLVLQIIVNSFSPITGLICLICLVFLFFESAFGICLGCKVYPLFNKGKVQYCPGEVCDVKSRHEIQKTTPAQWMVVAGLAVFIVAMVFLFNDFFRIPPYDLFGLTEQKP